MLSQRRGEVWAAPESDYSRSLSKRHCQPWATRQKVVETAQHPAAMRGTRSRDETNLPATKHFRACDDKLPKPSPRSSPAQRGATPAQKLGRSIRCHTIHIGDTQ